MDEEQKDLIRTPEEERPVRRDMTKFHVIRILVAGYIAYLGADLLKSYVKGTAGAAILVAAIVFLLAGVGVVGWTVWQMVKGR